VNCTGRRFGLTEDIIVADSYWLRHSATKVNSRNHGYQKTLEWIDRSLTNFGMDYIDLFLIHDPLSGKERRLETWRAAIKARDDGKLRSIGVSN
jgi:diketogulonate reductase-like aldo/keto reductase